VSGEGGGEGREEGGERQLCLCQSVMTRVRPGHRPAQAKDRKQVALLRLRRGGARGGPRRGARRPQ
jgi:hypothetical protein